MGTRHVDSLALTSYLLDDDYILTEENDLLRKIKVSDVSKAVQYSHSLMSTPAVYTRYQIKGGASVYSKRSLYLAIKSLISAAYGNLDSSNKIKLFILSDTFREAIFSIDDDEVTATFSDDSSTEIFSLEDWTEYEAVLVSPWGEVPNSEDFAEDLSDEALTNRRLAFSDEKNITSFSSASGTLVLDRQLDSSKKYPFFVLYQDSLNYITFYYLNSKFYVNLITPEGSRTSSLEASSDVVNFNITANSEEGYSVTFNNETLIIESSEGDAFGYIDGENTYVFGYEDNDTTYVFGVKLHFDNPTTIYIGKDFNDSYFDSPIYNLTHNGE